MLLSEMREGQTGSDAPVDRADADACFAIVRKCGFQGSASIEFTRGIGRDEDIERIYENACMDLKYCREALAGPE